MAVSVTTMSLDFDSSAGPSTEVFGKKEVTIGRLSTNDIVLNHQHVSGKHAKLVVAKGEDGQAALHIVDLGSKNGTFIGSVRLIPNALVKVSPHDRIRIANFLMRPVYAPSGTEETESQPQIEIAAAAPSVSETQLVPSGRILSDTGRGGAALALKIPEPCFAGTQMVAQEEVQALKAEICAEEPLPEPIEEPKELPVESEAPVAQAAPHFTPAPVFTAAASVVAPFHKEAEHETEVKTFNFLAIKLCTLSISVVHRGRPVEGVLVYGGNLGNAKTDHSGVARFENVREGTSYAVSAERPGYLFRGSDMSGLIDGDETVVLGATKLYTVRGSVLHHGLPLSGAEVDAGVLGKTFTDEQGTYVFKDVPEDVQFDIRVVKPGYVVEPLKAAA